MLIFRSRSVFPSRYLQPVNLKNLSYNALFSKIKKKLPVMFVRRTTVIRSLLLFPPKHFSFLKQRVESGKHLKNNPDSSMLKTSSALYFCKICLSFSFHSSHVFSGTLPLSPQIFRKQISCLFLNLSNQPLLHLKSGRPREFAKTLALS